MPYPVRRYSTVKWTVELGERKSKRKRKKEERDRGRDRGKLRGRARERFVLIKYLIAL